MTPVLVALAVVAAAVRAPSAEFFVNQVSVAGGNTIRGSEDGVIYKSTGCAPGPFSGLAAKPFAASVKVTNQVQLNLRIAPCGLDSPQAPPETSCLLLLGKEIRETFRFRGPEGHWTPRLPARTGLYDVSLECAVNGKPNPPVHTVLYLTHRPPLSVVQPPEADWYLRASTWAAGLTAADPERAVFPKMVDGMFAYGQRSWRYGYCLKTKDPKDPQKEVCVFNDTILGAVGSAWTTTIPADSPDLVCPIDDQCVCTWDAIVRQGSTCNFGDCFAMTDVLHYISATAGAGGLVPEEVEGNHDNGFTTHGTNRPFDPGSLGNLLCGERDLPCAFLFAVHSLRSRDGQLYDPTFGRVYTSLGELYAASIRKWAGLEALFKEFRACPLKPGYGQFLMFRQQALTSKCTLDERRPAVFGHQESAAWQPYFVAGDDKPEGIEFHLRVEVSQPGDFLVLGLLFAEEPEERLVGRRPSFRVQAIWPTAQISGGPGSYPVALRFSGEDLARSGVTGPYRFVATIFSPQGISDSLEMELPAASFSGLDLGEAAARFPADNAEVEHRLVGQDDDRRALRIRVPVTVRKAGLFAISARLSSEGTTLAYSGARRELSESDRDLTIDFPEEEIALGQIEGAYDLTVELDLLDPATSVPRMVVDAFRTRLGPLEPSNRER